MMLRQPIFRGRNEIEQIQLITELLGYPTCDSVKKLRNYEFLKPINEYKNTLRLKFKEFPNDVVDLLEKLLDVNPSTRISVKEALNHPWFTNVNDINTNKINLPSLTRNEKWIRKLFQQQENNLKVIKKRNVNTNNGINKQHKLATIKPISKKIIYEYK